MLGPVANASQNPTQGSALLLVILLLYAGLSAGLSFRRQRKRMQAIRELAVRLGFTYIGQALPRSISLLATSLQGATAVWNVIDGECNKIRVVAFDCRIGGGKGSWSRTVIAAQTDADAFATAYLERDLIVERSGDWAFLYQPRTGSLVIRGLMSVDEIEARLNGVVSETTRVPQ